MSALFSDYIRDVGKKSKARTSSFVGGYPSKGQLFRNRPPELTKNKIDETYFSVSEYLEIQCDLLLEDFMHPLRESLKDFKRNRHANLYDGARIFRGVKLIYFQKARGRKNARVTCFLDLKNVIVKSGESQLEEPGFGYLLLFTRSDFDKDLFLGKVIYDKEETDGVKIQLKLFKDYPYSIKDLEKGSFTMMQADSFFYMYDNVLAALSTLNEFSFPMKKYIVYGGEYTTVKPPSYLTETTVYNVGSEKATVLDLSDWPSRESVQLDEPQYASLKRALTEEVVLIQGPPGTGKTYFGVRLVKLLLENVDVWNPIGMCPLLVVCHSNQALDHFLEELLAMGVTGKIVRVGGQSQSEVLKPYLLPELICRQVAEAQPASPAARAVKSVLGRLDEIRMLMNHISAGIVHYKTFEKWNVIDKNESSFFASGRSYLEWMGFDVEIGVRTKDSSFIILVDELQKEIEELKYFDWEKTAKAERGYGELCEFLLKMINDDHENHGKFDKDISMLSPAEAQTTYILWVDSLNVRLVKELESAEKELERREAELNAKQREKVKLCVLQSSLVVGLTSTAASARRDLLEAIQSPIVVVEEAAEVLEAHVVVSMTTACQHLILLGDHKQLKPNTTTHRMAVDYHLNMSLFERLLRNNVVQGMCLTTQYRMRPEISALLKPHFYCILDDAPTTLGRSHVRGLEKSVFFLNHEEPEQSAFDDKGYYNTHEVKMLINLARYLIYVGHSALKITIISMYGEQRNRLIKERDEDPALINLDIASVDSFQGRENEIILVSLVRSNPGGQIGFLKEDNRVCVALSRARTGLYIMGNMKCLTKPCRQNRQMVLKPVWTHAQKRLQEQNALGSELTLVCPVHKSVYRVSQNKHWYRPFCDYCFTENEVQWENEPKGSLVREFYNGEPEYPSKGSFDDGAHGNYHSEQGYNKKRGYNDFDYQNDIESSRPHYYEEYDYGEQEDYEAGGEEEDEIDDGEEGDSEEEDDAEEDSHFDAFSKDNDSSGKFAELVSQFSKLRLSNTEDLTKKVVNKQSFQNEWEGPSGNSGSSESISGNFGQSASVSENFNPSLVHVTRNMCLLNAGLDILS